VKWSATVLQEQEMKLRMKPSKHWCCLKDVSQNALQEKSWVEDTFTTYSSVQWFMFCHVIKWIERIYFLLHGIYFWGH